MVTGANRGIGLEVVRQLSALLAGAAGPDSPTATVILCARSAAEGAAAAAALNAALTTARAKSLGAGAESSVVVVPQQLDVTSVESCVRLSKVCSGYGGIDVLINNAGFAHHLKTGYEQARTCVDVNFLGTMNVLASLLPLAQPGARFINVSSTVGQIGRRGGSDGDSDGDRTSSGGGGMGGCPLAVGAGGKGGQLSAGLRRKLLAPDLTVEGLTALVETFVEQAKRGEENNTGNGGEKKKKEEEEEEEKEEVDEWPESGYAVSKMALTQLTRIMAKNHCGENGDTASVSALSSFEVRRQEGGDSNGRLALLVAVCPGLVRTGMTDPFRASSTMTLSQSLAFWFVRWVAGKSAAAAAADIVFLAAELPAERCDVYCGKFAQGRQIAAY